MSTYVITRALYVNHNPYRLCRKGMLLFTYGLAPVPALVKMDNTKKRHLITKTSTWKFLFSSVDFAYGLYYISNITNQQVVYRLFSQYFDLFKIISFQKDTLQKHHEHTAGSIASTFNIITTRSHYLLMSSFQLYLSSSYKTRYVTPEIVCNRPFRRHFMIILPEW